MPSSTRTADRAEAAMDACPPASTASAPPRVSAPAVGTSPSTPCASRATRLADHYNRETLSRAFPDLLREYVQIAKERGV